MSEEWRPIEGYPGYDVSDQGRVRSYYKQNVKGSWSIVDNPQRMLKGGMGGRDRNRRTVSLRQNGSQKTFNVHKLVATAFLGPCPDWLEICHNDSDSLNDRAKNLRYDTRRANTLDMVNQEDYRSGNCKLTNDQTIQLRILRFQGSLVVDLVAQFGIHSKTVARICTGKTYQNVGGPRVKYGRRAPHPLRKLTWQRVCDLRRDREAGMGLALISRKYGVSESMCSLVAHYKRRIEA